MRAWSYLGKYDFFRKKIHFINTQAVGMNSWIHSALKSILSGNPIFESSAWFFVFILKFIYISIFVFKIHEKKFLDTKKILFSKAD